MRSPAWALSPPPPPALATTGPTSGSTGPTMDRFGDHARGFVCSHGTLPLTFTSLAHLQLYGTGKRSSNGPKLHKDDTLTLLYNAADHTVEGFVNGDSQVALLVVLCCGSSTVSPFPWCMHRGSFGRACHPARHSTQPWPSTVAPAARPRWPSAMPLPAAPQSKPS